MGKPARTVSGGGFDPTIKFSTLKVDDEEYKLAYSFNAIAEAEKVANCNLLAGLESLNNLTAEQLRGLLYAALRVGHPSATLALAGKLIRLDTIDPVTTALAEAYKLSMPEKSTDPLDAAAPAAQD